MHDDSSRKATNYFEFMGKWSCYKILKIVIFRKLTGGFEISFKQQEIQTKMHSQAITGKHMPHLTVLTSFINRSHIRLLYFRFVCRIFNFDFTTIV